VKVFLESIKLEKYFDKLVDNGVEDLETILELQDSHIEQMGIPLGHKLKIMKKIKDLRTEKGISYGEGVSSKPVSNNQYEELPPPEEEHKSILKSKKETRGPQPDNSTVGMVSLKDGTYDE
jgi:hypothetical protein